MINILPPDVKKQFNYAKSNSKLLKYLFVTLFSFGLLLALLVFSLWYANNQVSNYQTALNSSQAQRASYDEVEKNVERMQSNLDTIEKLLGEKTTYSVLLADIASVLPSNSFITKMTLEGDDSKPMELLVSTDSINRAAEVRNGLISSTRIKSADIQTVTKNDNDGRFTVVLVIGFEAGGSR